MFDKFSTFLYIIYTLIIVANKKIDLQILFLIFFNYIIKKIIFKIKKLKSFFLKKLKSFFLYGYHQLTLQFYALI